MDIKGERAESENLTHLVGRVPAGSGVRHRQSRRDAAMVTGSTVFLSVLLFCNSICREWTVKRPSTAGLCEERCEDIAREMEIKRDIRVEDNRWLQEKLRNIG